MIKTESGSPQNPSLTFVGDYVGSSFRNGAVLDEQVLDHLMESNWSFVNLEAPIDANSPAPKFGSNLGQSIEDITHLRKSGFNAVTLANNHLMDQGQSGLKETLEICRRNSLSIVGAGADATIASEPLKLNINKTSVAVLNGCQHEFGIAKETRPGVAGSKSLEFLEAIEQADADFDIVVVVVHGGIEFVPIPPPSWQHHLRSIADRGADAIIGHHPHVILPWEIYNNVPIFYSLGNFAFNMSGRPEAQYSAMLDLSIHNGQLGEPRLTILCQHHNRIEIASNEVRRQWKERLARLQRSLPNVSKESAHWQEVANRIYPSRYESRLTDFGNGRVASMIQSPVYSIERTLSGNNDSSAAQTQQKLSLLNYLKTDSHRDVLETALGMSTGTIPDNRTPSSQKWANEMMPIFDTRLNWKRQQRFRWYLREAVERLRNSR